MDALKSMIEKVDDDYLTGLSNKGTLKRAYKDLEQEMPSLTWQEGQAQVKLREETCLLRMPLGESSCTCPSRSICRHILTAVLWMKGELAFGKEAAQEPSGASEPGEAGRADAASEAGQEENAGFTELLCIPVDRLRRACGGKRYGQLLSHMRAGELPPMTESSIVTVSLPWENATVRLLTPFEYSSCSCHRSDLCPHKAQALLAYQVHRKRHTLEELEKLLEPDMVWEEELVRQAGESICEELCQQLCTGLSRASAEAAGSLVRLAVIAHRAGLARPEGMLREAAAYYEQYFSRSARFRGGELMGKLLALYRTAHRLSRAEGGEEIRLMAGSFRDAYLPVGDLHLVGMGARSFSSRTGYAGEIYYFLETGQRRWYTWTDARPAFYEGRDNRRPVPSGSAPAPWGLNCSRETLQSLSFDLRNARVASGRRLSASQECHGEATGNRSMEQEEIRQMIWWDYEKLLLDSIRRRDAERGYGEEDYAEGSPAEYSKRREYPVLVGAVRWDEASFDKVRQRFSWNMYDTEGRRLCISVNYTKQEGLVIGLLERLEQRLGKRCAGNIVFFGSFYMDEEGGLCLYPIEFFVGDEKSRLSPERDDAGAYGNLSEENRKGCEALPGSDPDVSLGEGLVSMEILESMEGYCRQVRGLVEDLFISGLVSLTEETLSWLERLSREGEQMGLHQAGLELMQIHRILTGRRHQMEFSPEPAVEALSRLAAYLDACQERLLRDKALVALQGGQI